MAAHRTTEYAVCALVVLALEKGGGKIQQAAALARSSGTPPKFMEQVLRLLGKGGFVVSRRGAGGGYELARAPERIRLGEVVSWMEGIAERAIGDGAPSREWKILRDKAEAARRAVLEKETLLDLAEKVQQRMAVRGRGSEYQI